jgi:uncharacterized protein (AIM24 family)
MTLSPAAQAVYDAYWEFPEDEERLAVAAALRAAVAATQMRQYGDRWICDADELLAIANELSPK